MTPLFKYALIFACLFFAILLQYGFIFLIIALLPAVTAYFIDHDTNKSTFKIVLLANVAAMLPALMPMLSAAANLQRPEVMSVMSDVRVWLVIYCGAAAGWCLLFLCRYISRFLVVIFCNYQVTSLERFQKKLLVEWGDKIQEGPSK